MVALCRCPPSSCFSGRLSDWPDELAAFAVRELWVCNVGFCDGTLGSIDMLLHHGQHDRRCHSATS